MLIKYLQGTLKSSLNANMKIATYVHLNKQKFLPAQMKGLWFWSLIQIIAWHRKKKKELSTYYVQSPVPGMEIKEKFLGLGNLS